MSNHTPGPWINEEDETFVYALNPQGTNRLYLSVQGGYEDASSLIRKRTTAEEIKANARLIGSAPDLLEALKEAIEFANAANHHIAGQNLPASEKWLAIVAKAEGRS